MNRFSKLTKGNPIFTCQVCGRRARDVDGTNVRLCHQCYEVAGIENELQDGYAAESWGSEEAALAEIDRLNEEAVAKGGTIEGYPKMKNANAAVAQTEFNDEALTAQVAEVAVTDKAAHREAKLVKRVAALEARVTQAKKEERVNALNAKLIATKAKLAALRVS